MFSQTFREVVYSPYYRLRPYEIFRLVYAKWLFARHRLNDPAQMLEEVCGIDFKAALAGFDHWRGPLGQVIASVQSARGHQGAISIEDGVILYGITRSLRPDYVIETGVAAGVSTSFIGAALLENGHGVLYSIELPGAESAERAHSDGASFDWPSRGPGWALPQPIRDALGDRHRLVLDDVRDALPALIGQLPYIDIFFHDDLHTPPHMLWEYELVWPRLRPGGALISDDANFGWIDFCRRHALAGNGWANIQRLTTLRKPMLA